MKNKMLLLLSMMVIFLFVVSCAPKMSDEELETELGKLSPEELEAVTAEDSGTLSGMAKANPNLINLQRSYKAAVKVSTCSDTDQKSGDASPNVASLESYSVKGTVTAVENNNAVTKTDYCQDSDLVVEYHCNILNKMVSSTKSCAINELVCLDGACKQPADLVVTSAEFSMVLNQTTGKDDVKYVATVTNAGAGNAGLFAVSFLPTYSGASKNIHYAPSLAGGANTVITGQYTPVGCPGTHLLNITADVDLKVAELDETNNQYNLDVTC